MTIHTEPCGCRHLSGEHARGRVELCEKHAKRRSERIQIAALVQAERDRQDLIDAGRGHLVSP